MKIKIGTRKSRLAIIQTEMTISALNQSFPDIETEIVPISTKGDKILDKPLSQIGGKGIFVSEIESALQSGKIDIAIHSAKDLPVCMGDGLEISGTLKRGNYRDVLVTMSDRAFEKTDDFIIGTGSLRRRINIKKLYKNADFKDIRGNVDTRLRKLADGEYDAVILAAAGLERLGLLSDEKYMFYQFDFNDFLPAPCQGIIAIESRKNDFVTPIINKISDKNTFYCFETERTVLEILNADCTMPVGAYSEIKGNKVTLTVSADSEKTVSGTADISHRYELARELILQL